MIYQFHDYELDEQLYQLRRCGEIIPLEPQVYRLLVYLVVHRERVVSREELFEQLWPDQVVGDAALTYCVAKARKAVQDAGTQQRILKTIHGHGYRFIAEVLVVDGTFATSVSKVQVAPEAMPVHMPSSSYVSPPSAAIFSEKAHVLRPVLYTSRQSRQLTVVGCLFVCGWVASLWQMAAQSPWKFQPVTATTVQVSAEVPNAAAMPCRWWILSTHQQPARDAMLQGWIAAARSSPAAKMEARWLFQRAIELDPMYGAAYASLGVLAWQDWLSWSSDTKSLEQASLYLQKAAALDSSCPQVLTLLSQVLFMQRRQAQAVTEAERQLRPSPLPSTVESSSDLISHYREVNGR